MIDVPPELYGLFHHKSVLWKQRLRDEKRRQDSRRVRVRTRYKPTDELIACETAIDVFQELIDNVRIAAQCEAN